MTDITPTADDARTRLALYPLTLVDEGDQVVIGRPDIDSFAVFPPDAAAVVRRLRAGEDLGSVATWYEDTYGEPADIHDFVATLYDLGFVRADGTETAELPAPPVRWRRTGATVLSWPALTLYALAVGAATVLMVAVPALRPGPAAVYFSRSLLVVMSVTTVAQLAGVAWHESFHVLAGRRIGIPSKLSIGRRLYFIVFQTTLSGLMGVPARKRILPFCAGLIADALLVSLLIGVAEAGRLAGWPSWPTRVAVGLAYVTILRMLWQALIVMETDVYHVLASALRCPDLHGMTRTYLRNRISRARGRLGPDIGDESAWSARDRRVVRRYAPFVVIGSAALIALAVVSVAPVLSGLALRVYHGITTGSFTSPWFWDSLLAGIAVLAPFAIAGIVAIRDRKRHQQSRASSATSIS
jgi:hypothetical protein